MSARELRIVLIAVMTGMFLGAIDGTIVATALPTIVGDLGGQSQAPWLGTGFLLAQTIGTPIIGKLSDIYGRKVTFQTTIVAFLATSLLCGIAQTMFQLVAFRFLQGVAAAGLLALPFAIMGDLMSPTERARNQGYAAGAFLVAALVGPLLGGLIVDASSWRWIFLINLPVGAVALVAVQKHLVIPRQPTRAAIDVPGAITLSLATGPLVVGLLWSGKEYGWTSAVTLTLFGVAAVSAVAFVLVEFRAAEPILPLSLFSNRVVRTTLIGGFVSGVAVYALSSYSPVFMQIVHGTSATASGLWSIPNMVMVTFASVTSGRLIARYGSYRPYPILGCVFMVARRRSAGDDGRAHLDPERCAPGGGHRPRHRPARPEHEPHRPERRALPGSGRGDCGSDVREITRWSARLGNARSGLPQPAGRAHSPIRR